MDNEKENNLSVEQLLAEFDNIPPYKYDGVFRHWSKKLSGVIDNPKFADYINHENFGAIEYLNKGRFIIVMNPIKVGDEYYHINGEKINMDDLKEHRKLFTNFELVVSDIIEKQS